MSVALKYRSDIDGLRALAVLGVVIYHAFPQALPGGFSGVDIFFVISGYLISGILYKGHREGGFSFGEFYARRVRRLFPALITMLVVVMGYGWVVMLPDEFSQMGKHVAAGGVFVQNVVYWKESGYFDVAANLKPLLHMWSLAVEEQFYIFFPLLLVVLWRRAKVLVPVMVVLLVVSFAVNVVMSVQNGASDFFLTPYRAWEFLGGSLLAWWHYERGHEEEVPAYREAMSWVGAGLLVGGMALLGKEQAYPGWRALMPVAGTLLLMEAGGGAWVNRKVLSHPAVVWVGLISYPLYLFHWPALSFVHIVKGESPKAGYVWGALGVALALTLITYYLVEKPLRHRRSRWVLPSLVAAFLACALSGTLIWNGIIQVRIPQGVRLAWIALKDRDMTAELDRDGVRSGPSCSVIGGKSSKTLFFGDSNAMQYAPRICKVLGANSNLGRGAIFLAKYGVPPIPGLKSSDADPYFTNLSPNCEEILRGHPEIDRVVIAARWNLYFDGGTKWSIAGESLKGLKGRNLAMQSFRAFLKSMQLRGKKVIVVLNIPTGWSLHPKSIFDRTFTGPQTHSQTDYSLVDFLRGNGSFLNEIRDIASEEGAVVIDPVEFLSTNGICLFKDGEGIPIRYDADHLRPGYVREQVTYLDFTVEP
jgi:peptidoglycan/LPS O-acetylase OafA/YrhL